MNPFVVTYLKSRTYKDLIIALKHIHDNDENPVISVQLLDMKFRVFLVDEGGREGNLISMFYSSEIPEYMCLMVYDAFFELKNLDAQWFLLVHELGHHKTSDCAVNGGTDRIRRYESFNNGKVSELEIKADEYAYQILKSRCIPAMEYVARYLDNNYRNPYRLLELRRRIKIMKEKHQKS